MRVAVLRVLKAQGSAYLLEPWESTQYSATGQTGLTPELSVFLT